MQVTIGLFDSGLGGLTVLKYLQSIYQEANFIYVADYAYNPYGVKDYQVIEERVKVITRFLEKRCDVVVIACNTASIHIDSVHLKKPLYGVIKPTADYAVSQSQGHIGVFATDKTIEDGMYQRLIEAAHLNVTAVKASAFVDIIESNRIDEPSSISVYKEKLNQLKAADTIILGCTHFDLITEHLKAIDDTKVYITSNKPVADLLKKHIKASHHKGHTTLCLTQPNNHFIDMVHKLNVTYQSIVCIEL